MTIVGFYGSSHNGKLFSEWVSSPPQSKHNGKQGTNLTGLSFFFFFFFFFLFVMWNVNVLLPKYLENFGFRMCLTL